MQLETLVARFRRSISYKLRRHRCEADVSSQRHVHAGCEDSSGPFSIIVLGRLVFPTQGLTDRASFCKLHLINVDDVLKGSRGS